jgi:tryptophan-rich sensory protein
MMPESLFTKALLGGALFCIVLAVVGGLLTRLSPWYHALRQPSWKPPDWAFGPIWTVVFVFLTCAIAYAWDAASPAARSLILTSLAINGILNMAWSGIFFVMKSPSLAFVELVLFWISIAGLVAIFGQVSSTAALLLIPYLMWVTAAGVLNFQIIRMNRA